MKKIIAAIDGLKFSKSTIEYAVSLAKQTGAFLVGVFLEDFTYHSYKIYELVGEQGVSDEKRKWLEEKDKDVRMRSVNIFESICRKEGVNYGVHHNKSVAIQELLHESIYADLLVIDSKETLTHFEESIPTAFIRDLLGNVQCPVLVVPAEYKPVEEVILLYDGEPSSVYAIKMFSYTFPTLKELPTEVLSVKDMKQSMHLPDNKLMKEFMKRHYPHAEYAVLKGDPETEIMNYLQELEGDILVVLGAYRRGVVSRWFKPSMADVLMKDLKAPLFIAHNK